MSGVQRFLANDRNQVAAASLSASAVLAAQAVRQMSATRAGNGRVVVAGAYVGAADTTLDIEIVSGGTTARASEAAFAGVGSGDLLVNAIDTGASAQTLTYTLVDLGTQTTHARLAIGDITLQAVAAGAAGNAVRLTVTPLLAEAATSYSLLEDWAAGTAYQEGEQWDFGGLPLTSAGDLDPATPRIKFGADAEVYRPYREYAEGAWRHGLSPTLKRDAAAGTAVLAVTGSYTVSVTDGANTETYTGVVTFHDLVAALAASALVEVVGVAAADRAPGGSAAVDIPLRTSAWLLSVGGDVALDDIVIHAAAPTQKILVECANADGVGAETWNVSGAVSGHIGQATTGVAFTSTAVDFTVPAPTVSTLGLGTFKTRYIPVARETGDPGIPSVCGRNVRLGASARAKTITFVYEERPNDEGCDCNTALLRGRISAACLGLVGEDDAMTSAYTPASITRLKSLYDFVADQVRANSEYVRGAGVQELFINDLRNAASEFDEVLLAVQGEADAETAWDAAVSEWMQDVASNLDAGVAAASESLTAGSTLVAGQIVGASRVVVSAATVSAVAWANISEIVAGAYSPVVIWREGNVWRFNHRRPPAHVTGEYFYGAVAGSVAQGASATVTISGSVSMAVSERMAHICAGEYMVPRIDGYLEGPDLSTPGGTGYLAAEIIGVGTAGGYLVSLAPQTVSYLEVNPAVPGAEKYGFVLAGAAAAAAVTVNWYGANTALSGLTPSSRYMPSTTVPGGVEAYSSGTDMTAGAMVITATSATAAAVTGNGDTAGSGAEIAGANLINDRHRSRLAHVYICAGLSPKSSASGKAAGDGCWRDDPTATHWWVDEDGYYFPAFSNQAYISSAQSCGSGASAGIPLGQPYSTREFGLFIGVGCTERLKVGDRFVLTIEGVDGERPYSVGDSAEINVVAGGPAYLNGGATGSDTLTWAVSGTVSGALPAYALGAAEPDYHQGGADVVIHRGGIPFALGDRFTLGIEYQQYRWRRDGGSWSSPADIPAGATALADGLTAQFMAGPAPAFVPSDTWQFVARQPHAPAHIRRPDVSAWAWSGAAATLIADLGGARTLSVLALARYDLPTGAVVTIEGGDGTAWPESQIMDISGSVSVAVLATPWVVTHLRLVVATATGGHIGWWWAGDPLATTYSAARCRLARAYALQRGGAINPSSQYLGSGTGGEVAWTHGESPLHQADLDAILVMLDHMQRASEPMILVPHYLHPAEAGLVRVDVDSIQPEEFFELQPDATAHRFYALAMPLTPVHQ